MSKQNSNETTTSEESSSTVTRTPATKYGVKSAPEGVPCHSWNWKLNGGDAKTGTGVAVCRHCGAECCFDEQGAKGGKVRVYKAKGERKWSFAEPKCVRRSQSLSVGKEALAIKALKKAKAAKRAA